MFEDEQKPMQCSSNYKIHSSSKGECRNSKGKKKPVAIKQAKMRMKALKKKLGV